MLLECCMSIDLVKTIPQYIIPKQLLTTLAGCFANVKNPQLKNPLIKGFIKQYQVNMNEALIEDPCAYATFNDFFIRHLKPSCRPLAQTEVISPVDGCVSEIGAIAEGQLVQAKGRQYSVQELLSCNNEMAAQYVNGRFATLYLSPKDYHRIHMPIEAELQSMTYIPGALFSVQPTTARVVPKLFARNERLAVFFNTPLGPMAMVLVGATIVGAIGTSWAGDIKRCKNRQEIECPQRTLKQGEEMGYFKLGSTVVLLFADGDKVQWNSQLHAGSAIRFGETLV